MGSKRVLLANGLGALIQSYSRTAKRFIDPFCGSGAVAWYAAEHTESAVVASDLQEYAAVLARAVLNRTNTLDPHELSGMWFENARVAVEEGRHHREAFGHQQEDWKSAPKRSIIGARELCSRLQGGTIWNAYGGHYFSPYQALIFDGLRSTIPGSEPFHSVALAALISAASVCAASPGHTAQPLQPSLKGRAHILEAWRRNPFDYCAKALRDICPRHARVTGMAFAGDAFDLVADISSDDLVFLDPPYSGVHYSRFYHVLETIARGTCGSVQGVGRYPPPEERPKSLFSVKAQAESALASLLHMLATKRATVILTFPVGDSSNGLSGRRVHQIAGDYFRVKQRIVKGHFSTLGGNGKHRPARQPSQELILVLTPSSR